MDMYEERSEGPEYTDRIRQRDSGRIYEVSGLTLDRLADYAAGRFFECEALVRQGGRVVTVGRMTLEEALILGKLPKESEDYNGTDLELDEKGSKLARGLPKTLIVLKDENPHRREIADRASYVLTGQFPEHKRMI